MEPVHLSELADYISRDGKTIRPGCYGVSHGSGLLFELIRFAGQSWAGHAFVYVGNGIIVEGTHPEARLAPADSHPDAIWNYREELTDEQRMLIVAKAHALVGCPYNHMGFIGFALEAFHIANETTLDRVFKTERWRVCSALVADCYDDAGIDVEPGSKYPNLVSPGDLLERIMKQ
jgi:uncharacterized protein YycO